MKTNQHNKSKESICYKCSNPESSHYLVNYTDGIAQTKGVKICPTVVFVKRNY